MSPPLPPTRSSKSRELNPTEPPQSIGVAVSAQPFLGFAGRAPTRLHGATGTSLSDPCSGRRVYGLRVW